MQSISCFIFVARSDAAFLPSTLPPLCRMAEKANCHTKIIVDATDPNGVLGKSLEHSKLSKVIEVIESVKKNYPFEYEVFSPVPNEVLKLSKLHFGSPYKETHCFRGYPLHGSMRQFHNDESKYILHLDCDMIFYEKKGFSWIKEGVKIMEEYEDILCVLPRGGPPSKTNTIPQGTTKYEVDNKRRLFLFKNFSSRHYLINRERFLNLLPMKPLWLSWREPFKSALCGKGKMLCWEDIVSQALNNSDYWRADLQTSESWSIHPGDRSEKFYTLLPQILKLTQKGVFTEEQTKHFDLHLTSWEDLINGQN